MPVSNPVSEAYRVAKLEEQIEQHLDMESSILWSELRESEVLRKVIHHFKLVSSQMGKILDNIPETITMSDNTVTILKNKDDLELLKKMLKQLDVFSLPDITPELERDMFIYVASQNWINAYDILNEHVDLSSGLDVHFTVTYGALIGRRLAEMYWKFEPSEYAMDMIDNRGYDWVFIDPNNEVTKLGNEENLSPTQARAKIMQRCVDYLYSKDEHDFGHIVPQRNTFNYILTSITTRPEIRDTPEFIKAVKTFDPSRYLIEETEETT